MGNRLNCDGRFETCRNITMHVVLKIIGDS